MKMMESHSLSCTIPFRPYSSRESYLHHIFAELFHPAPLPPMQPPPAASLAACSDPPSPKSVVAKLSGASLVPWFNAPSRLQGCPHYRRRALLFAPCCNAFFSCRYCHNEATNGEHTLEPAAVESIACSSCIESRFQALLRRANGDKVPTEQLEAVARAAAGAAAARPETSRWGGGGATGEEDEECKCDPYATTRVEHEEKQCRSPRVASSDGIAAPPPAPAATPPNAAAAAHAHEYARARARAQAQVHGGAARDESSAVAASAGENRWLPLLPLPLLMPLSLSLPLPACASNCCPCPSADDAATAPAAPDADMVPRNSGSSSHDSSRVSANTSAPIPGSWRFSWSHPAAVAAAALSPRAAAAACAPALAFVAAADAALALAKAPPLGKPFPPLKDADESANSGIRFAGAFSDQRDEFSPPPSPTATAPAVPWPGTTLARAAAASAMTPGLLSALGLRPQPPAARCRDCGDSFGGYACLPCRLYDDEPGRAITHCDDCGLCRRGRGDDMQHCNACGVCFYVVRDPATGEVTRAHDDAACVSDALGGRCAVCYEGFGESRRTVQRLRCGHALHQSCLRRALKAGGTQCPVCRRSTLLAAPKLLWAEIDRYLASTRMPSQWAGWKAEVLCNDCLVMTVGEYHFSYIKCGKCQGYNTAVQRKIPPTTPSRAQEQEVPGQASSEDILGGRPERPDGDESKGQ